MPRLSHIEFTLLEKMRALVEQIAGLSNYEIPEDGSWSDNQAEDAIASMEAIIEKARRLCPHVIPTPPIKCDEG